MEELKLKKWISLLLAALMLFSLAACGNDGKAKEQPEESTTADSGSAGSEDAKEESGVEVDTGLFNVTITIPADFAGEITQEELDQTVSEKGYKSATLNDDGSVTYVMTKAQHKELMDEMKQTINDALEEMTTSGDYPSIVSIKPNSDFTDFTVTLSSNELGMAETFSAMALYLYGGMYNAFNGTTVDNIHVQYVNEDGTIIQEGNSSDLA